MKYKPGDLVRHARGDAPPFNKLKGIVVRDDLFTDDQYEFPCYRVFWYTIRSYQNLQESCLKCLDNSLT